MINKKYTRRIFLPGLILLLNTLSLSTSAEETTLTNTLSAKELFQEIRSERIKQEKINKERLNKFNTEKDLQQKRLKNILSELTSQKKALKDLKADISKKDQEIETLESQLGENTHGLKDLFSAWRQVATDSLINQRNSITSVDDPDSLNALQGLVIQKQLPTAHELELLGSILQKNIVNSGQVTQFSSSVAFLDGVKRESEVQRIGTFTLSSEGQFLRYDGQTLAPYPRQPSDQTGDQIISKDYTNMVPGTTINAVIDPSRGVVLERLAQSPTWVDRLHQGGYIGYSIIFLGAVGILLALLRWLSLSVVRVKIHRQMKNPDKIDTNNPLGKILSAYKENVSSKPDSQDTDTLEVRLQEIVLQEMPKLDKGLGTLKLLAAVAPLLGLLGTVVGMINTFQTITLVGNADPKLMAGGISQALMTTVLGLITAVPLLFSHSFVSSRARLLMTFLSQQSLGYIAQSLATKHNQTTTDSKE